ncbi:MAG: hypothetical protein AAF567_03790 [Actinomycetota bacterium]
MTGRNTHFDITDDRVDILLDELGVSIDDVDIRASEERRAWLLADAVRHQAALAVDG